MHILLVEPYYGGSHRAWADGYRAHSRHEITLLTLPGQFWKWRMQGGAISIDRMIRVRDIRPDVILFSSMINLATFRALSPLRDVPTAIYFHESQFTYPQNSRQQHGWRYAFVNYISALTADAVFFNSPYHMDNFFQTLPNMLKHFGDYTELQTIEQIQAKASVLPLGLDLRRFDEYQDQAEARGPYDPPLILWNHRWESDKNPKAFFRALYILAERLVPFRVAITGQNFRQGPTEFEQARAALGERVVQYGYMPDFASYARLLWSSDLVVSTAQQEFFGIAVSEGIYCGGVPILPDRLNYPNLVPEDAHDACLYTGKGLAHKLEQHIIGKLEADRPALRDHIAQFDWETMAPQYDDALEALV